MTLAHASCRGPKRQTYEAALSRVLKKKQATSNPGKRVSSSNGIDGGKGADNGSPRPALPSSWPAAAEALAPEDAATAALRLLRSDWGSVWGARCGYLAAAELGQAALARGGKGGGGGGKSLGAIPCGAGMLCAVGPRGLQL